MKIAVIYDAIAAAENSPDGLAHAELIEDIAASLASAGHEPLKIGCGRDLPRFIRELGEFRPGTVFNLCESMFGESSGEPAARALVECLGFPCTGAGSRALSLARDKYISKSLLAATGLPTPGFMVCADVSGLERLPGGIRAAGPDEDRSGELAFPLIVKPSREDGSLGIEEESVITGGMEKLTGRVEQVISEFRQPALVENFVEGREINAALLGNENPHVLPLSEIIFTDSTKICGYSAKWVPESPRHASTTPLCPARLAPGTGETLSGTARRAALSHLCRGYTRVDFRLDSRWRPYVIDINPNPDLGRNSGMARSARAAGLDYEALLGRIIELGLEGLS